VHQVDIKISARVIKIDKNERRISLSKKAVNDDTAGLETALQGYEKFNLLIRL
jgi:ribosomal protein S1